jgi:hypothetical protein
MISYHHSSDTQMSILLSRCIHVRSITELVEAALHTERRATNNTLSKSSLAEFSQASVRKLAGSIPDEVIEFFNSLNHSSRNVALGSTQPLTEMSTRNLKVGKGQPARKADNLTDFCEPIF